MTTLNKHYPSTPRVQLHRTRRKLLQQVEELLYSTADQACMFNAVELLETKILEQLAYPTP